MDFEPLYSLAGLLVGFIVGLTGMGGGALMTPILVLFFKIEPLAAVSSDLVASLIMKPFGAAVHMKRGKVHYGLVRWLLTGAIPMAFAGAILASNLAHSRAMEHALKYTLGITLLIAVAALTVKMALSYTRRSLASNVETPLEVKALPTFLIGIIGGLVVGVTSVGSGSLMIVLLLFLYPRLKASQLVGTDLVQAVPLVGAAALGHWLYGDVNMDLTGSLVVGAIPGVYIGSRLSARAPDHWIRPALMTVLLASGMKLVALPTAWVLPAALVGYSVWTTVALGIRRAERQASPA